MGRSKAIDILRAGAVLLVLGAHMDRCPRATSEALFFLTNLWATCGWVGVDIFFVMSGYLVSRLLFQEHARTGGISVKTFFFRRGFKIYPAFWILTGATVLAWLASGNAFKWLAVASEFLFIQNYGPALWNHTWSLAVEEHFYIFLALLLGGLATLKLSERPFRIVPLVFVALAATCLGLRLAGWEILPQFIDKLHLYPSHLRMDSLFAGVLVSYLHHTHGDAFVIGTRRWRWPLRLAGTALLLPAVLLPLKTTWFISTLGLTFFYTGAALILMSLLTAQAPGGRIGAAVAYVGTHSYSIYLWHMPVLYWLVPAVVGSVKAERSWYLYFLTCVLGSIGGGILLANLIEFPMLRWRDRHFPSRSR